MRKDKRKRGKRACGEKPAVRNIKRRPDPLFTAAKQRRGVMNIFHSVKELKDLDKKVNKFIGEKDIKKVISVSDTCTIDTLALRSV